MEAIGDDLATACDKGGVGAVRFVILGKIKPAVRMTQRGKWVDPQAQEYLASKQSVGLQLRQQMTANGWEMLPPKTPLSVRIVFTMPNYVHVADIDNQIKATLDSAQGIVFKDDRWVDVLSAERCKGQDYLTVIEVRTIAEAMRELA